MSQRRIAVVTTASAGVAFLLALGLTLVARGGPLIIFLVFTAMTGLSATFYWSMKFRQ